MQSYIKSSRLFLLLEDRQFLGNGTRSALLADHNLKAVEVAQRLALLSVDELLGPGSLTELGKDISLLNSSVDSGGTGTRGNVDLQVGQVDILEVDDLSGDTVEGTVYDSLVLIDDFGDDDKLAVVLAVVDGADSADLDVTGEDRLRLFSCSYIGRCIMQYGPCRDGGGEIHTISVLRRVE